MPGMTTTPLTLGLIGAGNIGGTVARLAVAAGHDVVLSNSRGPETLADLVEELGPRARAATAAEAAAAGDVVVVSVPLKAYADVPVEPLAGKVVLDTNNYYPQRDGQIAELDDESTTVSELLQAHLPTSHVVKAFNNIYSLHLLSLARPSGDPERSVLAIAGDDADAKKTASDLLDSLGYDAHDVGPLAEGWRYQRDTPAYVGLYVDNGDFEHPVHADGARLDGLLAQAKRYRDME
ncbi:NADPH-dependent F420 reductase [Nocardioides sp.]|uniref:NADPH-dependent F420 reductase n=1 Tax=Nocardioides sp. TaxID=35761 RepID=UPI002715D14D|nr:NAD(P)-binding domain-containing protein [Nocardioides sp.]MDO9457511.1 NAD(P)-binding domain-containing protein [Nocardioides sp.]